VAELFGRVRVAGLPAWFMWRTFYLFRLPGLDRKLRVGLDWLLDFVFRRDLAQLDVERTQRLTLAHFEPGEVIVEQGAPADAFYLVMKGEVQVVRTNPDGTQIELARQHEGDVFGEVGLLRHRRRNATVRAVAPVDVVVVGGADFHLLAHAWTHLGTLLERTAQERA
jgi:NADH dehydrogenase